MTIITNKFAFTMKLISCLLIINPCPVLSIEESFCAGVGFINRNNFRNPQGVRSMGATALFAHPLNTFWASNHQTKSYSLDALAVTFNKVTTTDYGLHDLNGWLHINIKRLGYNGKSQTFYALAVWAYSEKRDAVGEFIFLDGNNCDKAPVKTKVVNYIPCSGVPIDSPMNPNMFIYTNPDDQNLVMEVNLLWRVNSNYCDKRKGFLFK